MPPIGHFMHTELWAMRCSTSRMSGYTPYFLLYSLHPLFAFDIADRTLDLLDWHAVASTEDLLAMCMQQIIWQDKKLVLALEQQKKVHQWAVDDFSSKHERLYLLENFFWGLGCFCMRRGWMPKWETRVHCNGRDLLLFTESLGTRLISYRNLMAP